MLRRWATRRGQSEQATTSSAKICNALLGIGQLMIERGEFGQSNLFGAEARLWQGVNFFKTAHRAQVIPQSFALVAKAVLCEFKKCSEIRYAQIRRCVQWQ